MHMAPAVNSTICFYMQLYAPTTLVPARDFWTLRYTTIVEDGSLVVCMSMSTNFNSIECELGYHLLLIFFHL